MPKRDIDKFLRDIEVSDCDGGIMCSENSGIACRNDLDLEIVGENEKPGIYLHHTGINPEKIQNLVDTTGAGDLFAAGFLSKFLTSNNLEACGHEGVKMASIIIQKFGARL